MAFTGKNPRFNTVVYTDQGAGTPPNPAAGSHALVDRSGSFFVRDSGGAEVSLTAGSQDSPSDAKNYSIACSVGGNALTITLNDKSGSTPSSGSPCNFAFRNATSATGDYSIASVTGSTTFTISTGSTFGQTDSVQGIIYVYALNNAGTVELAAAGAAFDEYDVQSTTAEGGAGAADSGTTLYSTTARSGKAIKLIAMLVNTQTTAGTWAAVPSTISLVNSKIFSRQQTKYLSTNTSPTNPPAVTTDLSFSNLIVGRVYRVDARIEPTSSVGHVWFQWGDGSVVTNYLYQTIPQNGGAVSFQFTAKQSAFNTYLGNAATTYRAIDGNSTPTAITGGQPSVTMITLTELYDTCETLAFT